MKRSLAWMLALGPIFSVAYFLRVGDSSFYIFDPYSFVLVMMALPHVSSRKLTAVFLAWLSLVVISGIGLLLTINTYGIVRLDQFIVGSLRYGQLILLTYMAVMLGRNKSIPFVSHAPRLLVLAACIPLVVGIVLLKIRPETVLVFDRFSSYLSSPNNVGAFICVAIPAVNYSLGLLEGRYAKIAAALVFYGFAVMSLVYAGSNSGWFACAVSFAISAWSTKGTLVRNIMIAGVVGGLLVTAGFAVEDWLHSSEIHGLRNTGELISTLRYGDQFMDLGSGRLRESLMHDAWTLYLAHPLTMAFGIGLGQSPSIIGAAYAANITAHNAFLVLLLETGLFGVLVLGLLILNLFKMVGMKQTSFPIVCGYLIAMLGTPHVYLPFLWAAMSFSLYLICERGSVQGIKAGVD